MADEEVATRAPESDAAAEQSAIPGDSKAQDGPSMGVNTLNVSFTHHDAKKYIGTLYDRQTDTCVPSIFFALFLFLTTVQLLGKHQPEYVP